MTQKKNVKLNFKPRVLFNGKKWHALPLELGMGGILVDGVADVYRLPATLVRD